MSAVYIPGDVVLHDGHSAVVLCVHPSGRLYIRPEQGDGDLLVAATECTSLQPALPADDEAKHDA